MKQKLLIMMLSAVSTMAAWGDNITFADANVKALCVQNWDTDQDGELSYDEAAAVTSLGSIFISQEDITSFDEFQYFTGLTTIGVSAFAKCTGLTSITIPSSVTSIGANAFFGCYQFNSVNITDIAAWCAIRFDDSSSNPLTIAHHLFLNGEEVTELVIPEGVTTIGCFTFYNCINLTSVAIPSSLTAIGDYAFLYCI